MKDSSVPTESVALYSVKTHNNVCRTIHKQEVLHQQKRGKQLSK